MNIRKYQRGETHLLRRVAGKLRRDCALRYSEFVDYYYGSSEWAYLLFVFGDDEQIEAVGGFERLPIQSGGNEYTLLFGSNFVAFKKGAAGSLVLHWLKNADGGMCFGGSSDTHYVLQGIRRMRFIPIPIFELNRPLEYYPGQSRWKRYAKSAVQHVTPKVNIDRQMRRLSRTAEDNIEVQEKRHFSADMLPLRSPFSFTLQPTRDYLNWRYNTELVFVRYRIFQLFHRGQTAGYVVFNELPDRILLAHCDGEDPHVLSHGIVAALAVMGNGGKKHPRVTAACPHPVMQQTLKQFGFRQQQETRPLVFGGSRKLKSIPTDTSQWLVNFDWGDNGLRPPFLGQSPIQ